MSIHFNQTGYDPRFPKKAVITGRGENCMILEERDFDALHKPEGKKQVKLSPAVFDEASGDTVRIADFSDVTKPGKYFLFSDGEAANISIKEKPFRILNNALVKAFYYQRCGCELKEKHAGVYRHGVCHTGKAVLVNDDGKIDSDTVIECSGGWHDAGDYGRYTVAAAAALGHLLYAYEMFPASFNDELNIPESGNGIPDILNECRYELEWMLKMQRDDGGVYHKTATRNFAPFIMPEDDQEDLFLFRVTHCSTADFAAAAALASRIFNAHDCAFAKTLLKAAEKAWEWMEVNPDFSPFNNPPGFHSGGYGDNSCDDELFWASAELYSVTKNPRYIEAFKKYFDKVNICEFGWRDTAGFGALCSLFVLKDSFDTDFYDSIKKRFLKEAEALFAKTEKSGYGTALEASEYHWGSILPILNNGIAMICAGLLTGDDKYKDAALNQLNYLLGMNATGFSFVTGFGERAFRNPHHRPSYADGIDDPVPGLVSGGPNKNYPDAVTKAIILPDTPPAKFYIDYSPTASANENAIYWNSPAVFVAAYFGSV